MESLQGKRAQNLCLFELYILYIQYQFLSICIIQGFHEIMVCFNYVIQKQETKPFTMFKRLHLNIFIHILNISMWPPFVARQTSRRWPFQSIRCKNVSFYNGYCMSDSFIQMSQISHFLRISDVFDVAYLQKKSRKKNITNKVFS